MHESIILSHTTEDEIPKIISSLNSSKSTGPNSIPTKILKLLRVQISKDLTGTFKISLKVLGKAFLVPLKIHPVVKILSY